MARRKRNRDDELIVLTVQGIGILGVLGFVFPPIRKAFIELASTFLWGACIVGLLLVVYFIFKRKPRSPRAEEPIYFTPSQVSADPTPLPRLEVPFPTFTPAQTKAPTLEEQLMSIDWFQFEKLIETVFRKRGYQVSRRGGANADGGIDLIVAKESERTAVQCKHWKSWNVGVATVRELIGSMTVERIPKGILISCSTFTATARELAGANGVELIGKREVLGLLKHVDAGFDPEIQGLLTDKRKVCPKCESEMVIRTTKKGANAGREFWGCSRYPRCKYMMDCE